MKKNFVLGGIVLGTILVLLAAIIFTLYTKPYFTITEMNGLLAQKANSQDVYSRADIDAKNFATKQQVLDTISTCDAVTVLQSEIQKDLNGITCNTVCGQERKCLFGYQFSENNGDPNVDSQKTGILPCDFAMGPMNTDYAICWCCPE